MYKYAQAIYEKAHDAADALKELVNRADEKLIDLQCYDHSKEPIYANVWDSFDGRDVFARQGTYGHC